MSGFFSNTIPTRAARPFGRLFHSATSGGISRAKCSRSVLPLNPEHDKQLLCECEECSHGSRQRKYNAKGANQMRFLSFAVRSYRSCRQTTFPLHPQLTALIGVNGSGKSNIMNALLLLRKACIQRLVSPHQTDESLNSCRLSADIQHEDRCIGMKAKVVYETDDHNSDDVQDTRWRWNLQDFTGESKWDDFPIGIFGHPAVGNFLAENPTSEHMRRVLHWYFPPERKLPPKGARLTISEIFRFFNGINYYSASQFSDPSRCPVSLELEEGRPIRKVRSIAGHERFILDLYRSFKAQDTQYERYLSTVDKNGIGLIDDLTFVEADMPASSYEVQSGGRIKRIERSRLLVVPSISVDGHKLSPNQLSEGTFKTLALLFYVMTDESRVLLLEEPEVCIHHGLLSSVMELIRQQSKTKQIVISTHSDFVLDHLLPENVILVDKTPTQGTRARLLKKSLSKSDYKALRTYLEESGNLGEYWKEGGLDNQ